MKHLLNGVAIAAALVIAAPAWAQNPSGGNSVNTPGPNPGGPGLTPYSSGGAPPPAAEPAPAAMPPAAMPPGSETNSSMPPMHHPMHPMHHARAMHAFHKHMAHRAALTGDTTAQLNREELARIQSGGMAAPPEAAPAPGGEPMPMSPAAAARMNRTPGGPKPSGSGYIPPSQPQ